MPQELISSRSKRRNSSARIVISNECEKPCSDGSCPLYVAMAGGYSSRLKDFFLAQRGLIKTKRLFGGCRARAGPLVEMTEKAISRLFKANAAIHGRLPALARHSQIRVLSVSGVRCSHQPIRPISEVWARESTK